MRRNMAKMTTTARAFLHNTLRVIIFQHVETTVTCVALDQYRISIVKTALSVMCRELKPGDSEEIRR